MIAFWTLFMREIMRFTKVLVQTIVTPFVSSLLYLLIFGVNLGAHIQMKSGFSYLTYLIPGLIMMGLINNAFQNSSSSLVNMKYSGELEDLRVAPLTNWQILGALCCASLVRGAIVAIVTWLAGSLFLFWQEGHILSIEHPLALIYFSSLAGLSFGAIGICIAFWAKSFDQMSAFSSFVLLPLIYLGGVFLSIDHLSPFWQKVASLNPLMYFIEGVRYACLGVGGVEVWTAVGVSLVFFLLLATAAHRSLSRGYFGRW